MSLNDLAGCVIDLASMVGEYNESVLKNAIENKNLLFAIVHKMKELEERVKLLEEEQS